MAYPTIKSDSSVANAVIAPNLPQHARGIQATFEVEFFDDAPNNTVPSVPANAAIHPQWSIIDNLGVQVASGVGSPGSAPGRWQFQWHVPPNADLSTQSKKWRVIWNIVTQTNRQLRETQPFDVIDLRTPDTLEDLRAHAYLVYAGQSERLILRLPRRPDEISVMGFPSVSLQSPLPVDTPLFQGSLAGSEINETEEQNLFAYWIDTPPLSVLGEYQIVWQYRDTVTSPKITTIQKLIVPPSIFWSLVPGLKTLIDKLQKKGSTIHAYQDADIYEYFNRGIGYLNSASPATSWDMCSFPYSGLTMRFVIEAAALVALQAQHLLAGELQFSFSGQRVSLDLDQAGMYAEVVQRLTDSLFSANPGSWARAKVDLNRQMGAIAHVANRMMGRWQYNNRTFKLESTSIGSRSPRALNGAGPQIAIGHTLTSVMLSLGLV